MELNFFVKTYQDSIISNWDYPAFTDYQSDGYDYSEVASIICHLHKVFEATKNVLDKDGWLHTGDLGVTDKDNFVFIKGRSKSLILGPSGQNIYPEELEEKFNNLPLVLECLVVDKNHKLLALLVPDQDTLKQEDVQGEKLEDS